MQEKKIADREIILDYRYNLLAFHSLMKSITWNQRHGLPVLDLPDQARSLRRSLVRFEELLRMIPNRRDRIIIRCRYALGWNWPDIADFVNLNKNTVMAIAAADMDQVN